jgi:hypothetical protein
MATSVLGSNNIILMTMNQAQGFVGIGTSNPQNPLDVNGNLSLNSNLYVRGVNYNFGREFVYSNDPTPVQTNGTTYLNKFSVNSYLEGGTYLALVNYGMRATNNSRIGMGRITLSNSQIAASNIHTTSNLVNYGADSWINDHINLVLPQGSNIFTFQYCVNGTGGNTTITMKDSSLAIIRTS